MTENQEQINILEKQLIDDELAIRKKIDALQVAVSIENFLDDFNRVHPCRPIHTVYVNFNGENEASVKIYDFNK